MLNVGGASDAVKIFPTDRRQPNRLLSCRGIRTGIRAKYKKQEFTCEKALIHDSSDIVPVSIEEALAQILKCFCLKLR